MALIATHLNAEVIPVVTVAIGTYSPSPPTSIPPPPFSPYLISLMVFVDVKHHVYLLIKAKRVMIAEHEAIVEPFFFFYKGID